MIPDVIKTRFAPWANLPAWVLCNQDKQPCTRHGGEWLIPTAKHPDPPYRYGTGDILRWKTEPQDHITTIDPILTALGMLPGYGMGIMLHRAPGLCCFDFDHVVSPDGTIPPKVSEFLTVLDSWGEYSCSGTGLHAFCIVDGNPDEFGFKKDFADGKFYTDRFIRMTGKVYGGYDKTVKVISEMDYLGARRVIGSGEYKGKEDGFNQSPGTANGFTEWPKELNSAAIPFMVAGEYIGRTSPRHGRTCLWAARIQCPNIHNHTGYERRTGQFNPDVAILSLWSDGSSSVRCNHNHCDPRLKPNLLLKLWEKIRANRTAIAKERLSKIGRVI